MEQKIKTKKMEQKTETFERIDFLTCKNYLNELGISDEEINKALDNLNITKRDLCDEKAFERPSNTNYIKIKEFVRVGIGYFKKYKGEYVKEYTANADIFLIQAQYQGLKHGKIIYQILLNRYKWMCSFIKDKSYKETIVDKYFDSIGRLDVDNLPKDLKSKTIEELLKIKNENNLVTLKESAWSLYEMHSINYEIYLHTEFGSLYVPIKAILENDFSIINKRMKSYAISYYDPKDLSGYALNHRNRTMEQYKIDTEKDYENMIKPLKSKEAKKLEKLLKK